MAPSSAAADSVAEFDNSGNGPICVPGFGKPVNFEMDRTPGRRGDMGGERFAHGVNDFRGPRLTVREAAMLRLMDALTDKPNWHVKVFDDAIVAKWHAEATAMPLISDNAFDWCITELRDKAKLFEETGKTFSYDSASRCVKSDVLVSKELRDELLEGVAPLLAVPDEEKDYHPGSNDQVLNLVHPSLFPLVYGRTRVLSQGGQVDLDNIFASVGQGDVALVTGPESEFWSRRFQWLPCDVEFTGDKGTDVRIASYVNNLHPEKHTSLYRTIEKMVGLSIPLWNDVLVKGDTGRTPLRIHTFGAEMDPELPDWAKYSNLPHSVHDEKFPEFFEKVKAYLSQPDRPGYEEEEHDDEEEEEEDEDLGEAAEGEPVGSQLLRRLQRISDGPKDRKYLFNYELNGALERKWKRIRQLRHPEPGQTYEEWKQGSVKTVMKNEGPGWGVPYQDRPFEFYNVAIEDEFRARGLQVIVKLASIELTPEKPEYAGGSWHVEGMLNEHIAATAIYYYDVDNVTESRLTFRQEASLEDEELVYEQDEHQPLADIFGTSSMRDEPAVQDLGSVATPQGRLLVFPNTLQHRVGQFRLADPARPGHRRFVVLWLVDPHYRVCSTRNVPPQQHDWWAEKSVHKVDFGKLPGEIINMITEDVKDFPMGLEEAKKLRLELMQERTRMVSAVESNFEEYNLCEH
ncbi:Protein of unknown function DUF4246 [Pleurostoma richardsiae]|uniref:Uncharacterized protein n=1 Tax=Pleurostoma richardsiae TaxID=41990 RepID=A0AA38RQ04_9PEZI|nr:Protein of unknown function DUF4246 [Pleurostoma richardsiae]